MIGSAAKIVDEAYHIEDSVAASIDLAADAGIPGAVSVSLRHLLCWAFPFLRRNAWKLS